MSTISFRRWRQIEQSTTGEEWKQLKDRKKKTDNKFKFGRGRIIKAEVVGMLPIRVAGSLLKNLMWTPKKGFTLTKSAVGHRI